jgi:predicted amidophosphoribosyltransferase
MLPPGCPRCGGPGLQGSCPDCSRLGGLDRARSLLRYEGAAARLTLSIKRLGRPGLIRTTGELLAGVVLSEGLRGEVVTFVPAGRRATRKGFDHAELLARAVAVSLRLPCRPLLKRVRDEGRQADCPREERRANAEGAYAARKAPRDVLLVDDVFTTGATVSACALALRASGASHVDVITLARSVRRGAADILSE